MNTCIDLVGLTCENRLALGAAINLLLFYINYLATKLLGHLNPIYLVLADSY